MRPSNGAGRPSCLAIEPRNMELSAERRVRLLAAFLTLDEDTQADALELLEDIASLAGDNPEKRREAREIIDRVYAIAGWTDEYGRQT